MTGRHSRGEPLKVGDRVAIDVGAEHHTGQVTARNAARQMVRVMWDDGVEGSFSDTEPALDRIEIPEQRKPVD